MRTQRGDPISLVSFLRKGKFGSVEHVLYLCRYVPLLEAILAVGISHHSVLEFMQSVMKQLETFAAACSAISDAERASLCIVWSHVASALTKYLKANNSVNQGNERHHDLSCFYLVLLFPFYHLYSITYKQVCTQYNSTVNFYLASPT
jgi:hypothetical protein